MAITNGHEHRINWSIKAENPATHSAKYIKSLGHMLFLRGDKVFDLPGTFEEDCFGLSTLYTKRAPMVPVSSRYKAYRDSHRLNGHEKSIGVLSNSQAHCGILEKTLRKATTMLQEKAFLHHYSRYGVGIDKFNEALITCEASLAEYKAL